MHLDPTREADAVAACSFDDSLLADPALRDDETGKLASVVSAHPLVRAALLQRQKRFAQQPGGAILDGRDIGTVIAPDADAKLFVKATSQVRARRRHNELVKNGADLSFEQVLADIRARDERDSGRATAPLTQAADAAALDTSSLTIEAAVARAIQFVDAQVATKTR
jgi:cytidylate kinase